MHGVLVKEGAKRKNWLERFFVFDAETCSLSYFEGSADGKLKGRGAFIRVEDVEDQVKQRGNRFDIVLNHEQRGQVSGVKVAAKTTGEKAEWLQVLQAAEQARAAANAAGTGGSQHAIAAGAGDSLAASVGAAAADEAKDAAQETVEAAMENWGDVLEGVDLTAVDPQVFAETVGALATVMAGVRLEAKLTLPLDMIGRCLMSGFIHWSKDTDVGAKIQEAVTAASKRTEDGVNVLRKGLCSLRLTSSKFSSASSV
jgi:hypothetical protein